VIDGKRKDWAPWATTITPPVSVHSHHNGGNQQALFLIVQDGGIYYHTRAMGFEFAEQPALIQARGKRSWHRPPADVSVQLQVRSLHPALGAEVRGIDMRAPLDPATFQALHDVWMQHLVLVFPGQHITDAEHVEIHPQLRRAGDLPIRRSFGSRRMKEIFRVSNVDDDGNLMTPDHQTGEARVALAQFWHNRQQLSHQSMRRFSAAWRGDQPHRRRDLSSPTCTPCMTRCPTHSSARCKGARRSTTSAHLHTLPR